jgi:hypothetical protein
MTNVDLNLHRSEIEADNEILREKLCELREKRKHVKHLRHRQATIQTKLTEEANASAARLDASLVEYQSLHSQNINNQGLLELTMYWNARNDCFHISHQGPYATINGLRLGLESQPIESLNDLTKPNDDVSATQLTEQPRRYFSFGATTTATRQPFGKPEQTQKLAAPINPKVPWTEINAALGQVALLLSTLEKLLRIKYRHEILPQASTSKIRIGNSTGTYYNLYYSENSFQLFFARRNFNMALDSLADCVVDAANAIQTQDRTITLPHVMTNNKNGSATTMIGGLPVVLQPDGGVEWTKAMKYLLTNIKHLMTFEVLSLTTFTDSVVS